MGYNSGYNLPNTVYEIVEELKKHGSAEYDFFDYEPAMEMDNYQAMGYFVDHVEIPDELIVAHEDSLVIFRVDGIDRNIAISSHGGGDFFSHCFSCSWEEA